MVVVIGACSRRPVARPPVPAAASTSTASPEVLVLAASAPVLPAGVSEVDDTMRYTIVGNVSAAIRAQLHPDGPPGGASDSEFVGYTATHIEWRFHPQHDSARRDCTLRAVHVTLTITTTLPVWRPASTPPPSRALVDQWTRFLDAVGRHEQGHANIARHTAADLYAHLDGATRPRCDSLAVAATADARAVWAAGHTRQLTYDVVTQHGIAQGTIWPP
jgi:predicted secreted Zn-dependent protease